jgi:hypothetical protein
VAGHNIPGHLLLTTVPPTHIYTDGCIHFPSFLLQNSTKMAFVSPLVLSVLFGAFAAYVINRLIRSKSKIPLPPGPRGLPFLGNVNDMPKDDGSLGSDHWLKHKDLYGPLSSVTVLGQTMIIINDEHIALEMLRDRAAKHSDRPHQIFSGEMYVTVHVTYYVHTLTCSLGWDGSTPWPVTTIRTHGGCIERISLRLSAVARAHLRCLIMFRKQSRRTLS